MTRFHGQDLTGARFERVSLRDVQMHSVDLTGAQIRGAVFNGSRMRGVELVDVEISGELQNVVINGVDIAPLVDAELNRRMPERAKMRPDDSDGFREAWAILERLWKGTVARAMPGRMPSESGGVRTAPRSTTNRLLTEPSSSRPWGETSSASSARAARASSRARW